MISVYDKQKISNGIYEIQNKKVLINFPAEQHKISCGHNEYKFSFRLSDEIPCSFEHSTGYVRYTLKVILVRPLKVIHERKTAFSVVSRYDLNAYQTKCVRN